MSSPHHDNRRFGLAGALGLSLLIHVLLALLAPWLPHIGGAAVAAAEPEASEITFTFVDRPSERHDRPAQDLPPRPSVPLPEARPTSEPQPPAELTAPQAAPEEPSESPSPEAPEEPPRREPDPHPEEEEGPPPSPAQGAASANAPGSSAGAEGAVGELRQALRDFKRAVPRSAAEGRPGPPEPRNIVVPDLSTIPQTGFGMGNLVFESGDYDWEDYGRQIYMAIWRAWHNRLWMSTDEFERWAHGTDSWYLKHDTQVRFVIEANGQVTGIVDEQASGCPPLDTSALEALEEVILPPLPADFPRDREVVHARFVAIGEVRAMRPVLRRMKAAGFF